MALEKRSGLYELNIADSTDENSSFSQEHINLKISNAVLSFLSLLLRPPPPFKKKKIELNFG